MKRTTIFIIFALLSTSVLFAQTREVNRANRQLNRNNLENAKEYIDEALEIEENLQEAETWIVAAKVYMRMYASDEPEIREQAGLDAVAKADEYLQRAQELDTEDEHILDIQESFLYLSELTFNAGVEAYNQERWENASDYFYRSYELNDMFGSLDTITLYNAAISAEFGGNFNKARRLYEQLVEHEYDQPLIYSSLLNTAMAEEDTTAAERYIMMGRERYPENLDLIFSEANLHIFTGNVPKARNILEIAVQRDPENPMLYFAMGANYDAMAQDTTLYNAEERAFAFEEAEEAYLKAIELESNFFEPTYNLGVLYFNEGIRMYQEADERLRQTHDFAQYDKEAEEFQAVWLQAQPYLEKAKQLIDETHADYQNVVIALMQVYARTDQEDKIMEMEDLYRRYFGNPEDAQ